MALWYRTLKNSVREYGSSSIDSGDGRDSAHINARSPDNLTGLVPMGSASLGLRQSLEQGNCARDAAQAVGDCVWRRRSAPPDARLRMLPCALLRVQPGDAESTILLTRSTGHASGDYVERRGDACKACLLARCCQKPAIHGRKKLCKVSVFEKCHAMVQVC